jgi:hypothetical protein
MPLFASSFLLLVVSLLPVSIAVSLLLLNYNSPLLNGGGCVLLLTVYICIYRIIYSPRLLLVPGGGGGGSHFYVYCSINQ